jgi:hypothetical protein
MSPSLALIDSTPHELYTSRKPSLSHLKVFGCDAFVYIPNEKRRKMENKEFKCIFIGYKEGMTGYHL